MTKLPLVSYRELRKVAEAAGFKWQRCDGSHNVFRNREGRTAVIPDHGSRVIVRPLLRKILRDLGIDVATYMRFLDER